MAGTLPKESTNPAGGGGGPQHHQEQQQHQHQDQDTTNPDFVPTRKTRKQWSIHGGPKGLLRRMRSQLAEDGCPESQLVMGRTLLEQINNESENEADEEWARLAVFWLTQASLQGNMEATTLLKDCLNNNIGICEHNYHEVRQCLAMNHQEKQVRRAAHLLFCSVSNGNDFITSSGLSSKVQEILSGEDCQSLHSTMHTRHVEGSEEVSSSLEERYGGERFSEDHIVSASVLYWQGRVPPLHHFLIPESQPRTNPILKTVCWPLNATKRTYNSSLHFLGTVLSNYLACFFNQMTPLNTTILLCVLACMYSVWGVPEALVILPSVVCCSSMVVMVVSSAHMLLNRKHFDSFHKWSIVFSHFCPELDTVQAEEKFHARCWKPYVAVMVSLLLCLAVVPLTSLKLMISFLPIMYIFALLTLLFVPERLSWWHFFSFVVHISAVSPTIHKSLGVLLLSVLDGTGLEEVLMDHHIDIWWRFKVHLGMGPLLHLLWCCTQLGVMLRYGVNVLPPHLVSIFWGHLAVLASHNVETSEDLMYPVGACILVVLLPAVTSLLLLVGPGLVVGAVCIQIGLSTEVAGLALVCGVFVASIIKHWCPIVLDISKVVLIGLLLTAIIQPSLFLNLPVGGHSNLEWESYKNMCIPGKETAAVTVHNCSPLQGTVVKWQGAVTQVNIVSVRNIPSVILSFLPVLIERPLRCYIGHKLASCPPAKDISHQRSRCLMLHKVLGSDRCLLENWNEYKFQATVAMTSSYWKFGAEGSHVNVYAGNNFREFMLGLQEGDQVEFIGTLTEGVGSYEPSVQLSSISCLECKSVIKPMQQQQSNINLGSNLEMIPSLMFNFFTGPLLTI